MKVTDKMDFILKVLASCETVDQVNNVGEWVWRMDLGVSQIEDSTNKDNLFRQINNKSVYLQFIEKERK